MKSYKAILWDVYGTLMSSRGGDLRSLLASRDKSLPAFEKVASSFDLEGALRVHAAGKTPAEALCDEYFHRLEWALDDKKGQGILHPEVRIDEIWLHVLAGLKKGGVDKPGLEFARDVALFFEQTAHPRTLYPGVCPTLIELRRRGLRLGIISNAQFYTRIQLDEKLRHESGGAIAGFSSVFDERLVFLSCDLGVSKPDPAGFRKAIEVLASDGVACRQCVYVGNDMLHDVWLAREQGMAAVLFAGDPGSVRWRRDDPRCAPIRPDLVVNDHREILALV